MYILFLTLLALIAFAANSILCRLALYDGLMDAGSFTAFRLISGAVMLGFIFSFRKQQQGLQASGSWLAAGLLFVYAITFSYAYIALDIATGALILFAAGQVTLILSVVFLGGRLSLLEWVGLCLALIGFVYLMLPSASTPSWYGLLLMSISGVAWGFYTLLGKGSTQPLADTASNFIRCLPLVVLLMLFSFEYTHLNMQGVWYAVLSGAIASGVGYTIWYMALEKLETIHAAVVQLFVPVLAAVGGLLFLDEVITMRLLLSGAIILCGILLVIFQRHSV
ncbi:DMT family transporter [Ghiorsea bivora]|uniref:DMT family transporter n=1 Tax=Ghiorsea bivora TaxID=1485545 RepID=UPI00056E36B5|nr:DMT family transporter [Ghiorsea bivora]